MPEVSTFLTITTLGRFSIQRNQDLLSGGNWNSRRVRELFKLLLSAERHRLHREQVQELFWPSSSIDQAANSFGKTLYLLRRALEPDLTTGKTSNYVSLEGDILFLVPGSMQIDADIFESLAKQLQATMHSDSGDKQPGILDEFDRALALYGGVYLPDDLYEDWAQRRRDRLHRTYCGLLEHAAKIALAGAQGQRACSYLQVLLEYNTSDEQTHRDLMLTYARMGRRSEALNQYQLLRTTLREELRVSPLPETVELYRAIHAGRVPVDLTDMRQPLQGVPAGEMLDTPVHTHAHAAMDVHSHEAHSGVTVEPLEAEGTATSADRLDPERVSQMELVGRAEELRQLRQAFARKEQHYTFFISGEAGIGKTRLAREFVAWAERQQATVLMGTCYEMSGTLPYQPVIDILTAHIRSSSPEQLRSALGDNAIDLAKIIHELRLKLPGLAQPEPLGPEVERRNLYNAVARYLNTIAAKYPLLLILDDLQWADSATLQLLSYVLLQRANSVEGGALFFLLLYRADEVQETHPLRSLLSSQMRSGHAKELRLQRLRAEEVQQLLVQMAGHEVRPSFSDEIYKHTEGNPFFIGESIRALIEEGKLKKMGERWQTTVTLDELALPDSVRLLIERRLASLSPACRTTLAYAALLGRQFNSTLLCRTRNLSEESIAEHVDDAIRARILAALDDGTHGARKEQVIDQDADLTFTHDKIREVLALWLNPLRRSTAHRQIAQAIETHYALRLQTRYGELAYHYQVAEEAAKAVEYLRKAAEQATAVYAFTDAANFMEKAVELLLGEENRPQRAELLRKLSVDAYLYIGRLDKAIEAGIAACALWQELGDPVKEAESRLDVSFSFHWMGREVEAINYVRRALVCLAHTPDETRLLARAHVQWGMAATVSGDIPVALEHLQRADILHAQIGGNDPFISVVALWARSWCSFAAGTLQQMLDYALRSAELCRAIHMFAWEPMMTYSAAWALMLMGRLDEAARLARTTLNQAQRHNAAGAQGWAHLVLSFVAIQQGHWEEAEHFAEQAATMATMMQETNLLARVFWGRSICAGWQDDWERSVELSEEALHIVQRHGELPLVYPYFLLQTAKAYFFIGKIERAQHSLDQAMLFAQEHQYRQLPALGYRLQGRILQVQNKHAEAENYFERSLAGLAALDDALEYARTQQAYSLFFSARNLFGDAERSTTLLQQANVTFEQLGVNG